MLKIPSLSFCLINLAITYGSLMPQLSVVGSALQMETQLEVKGKNDKELYELEL